MVQIMATLPLYHTYTMEVDPSAQVLSDSIPYPKGTYFKDERRYFTSQFLDAL